MEGHFSREWLTIKNGGTIQNITSPLKMEERYEVLLHH
jgi:hypothetical protein